MHRRRVGASLEGGWRTGVDMRESPEVRAKGGLGGALGNAPPASAETRASRRRGSPHASSAPSQRGLPVPARAGAEAACVMHRAVRAQAGQGGAGARLRGGGGRRWDRSGVRRRRREEPAAVVALLRIARHPRASRAPAGCEAGPRDGAKASGRSAAPSAARLTPTAPRPSRGPPQSGQGP